jgi:wyosine [tRNA(Phe)-imidazoG37] synthetase (radical SAM superfamily)
LAGGEAGFILKGVWLEVLLLAGVTGLTSEVEKIAALTRRIQPQRGLLNTVARPPSEDFAGPVSWSQLQEFANLFDGKAEVISEDHQSRSPVSDQATEADILALLNRRPCTVQGVSAGLGLPVGETAKRLAALLEERLATTVRINKTIFYETVRAKAN